MTISTLSTRAAGILLHPTSLPGDFGAGDLGPAAYKFAEGLNRAGLRWWQMLPTTPPGPEPEYSPYSSMSAFAGSPWLVSPELLFRDGLLSRRELAAGRRNANGRIDFPSFRETRVKLLRQAFAQSEAFSRKHRDEIKRFSRANDHWLDDYTLFAALKENQGGKSWARWPEELRLRKPAAMAAARESLADSIAFHRFVQWLFDRQWTALKQYCNELGVGLIGDIPIFVAHDSDAVWMHKNLFLLDSAGNPTVWSGYPPDPLSPGGQVWGHPHYRWPRHRAEGFNWWIARFEKSLRQFDAVRIDHFLGFHRVWAVPAGAKNAKRGKWMMVPGDELFTELRRRLGTIPIIAEDLGNQTPQAIALRDKNHFPGMRIIQFAFGGDEYHAPHFFPQSCVAYTGTHDNQTLVGWLDGLRLSPNGELRRALTYVGECNSGAHWNFIRALMASPAKTVIIPVQDYLGLGGEHRMNVPGVLSGNWGWRMSGPIPEKMVGQVRSLCDATHRLSAEESLADHSQGT